MTTAELTPRDLEINPSLWVGFIREELITKRGITRDVVDSYLPIGSSPLQAYAFDSAIAYLDTYQVPPWRLDKERKKEIGNWFSHYFSPTDDNIHEFHDYYVNIAKAIFDPNTRLYEAMPETIKDLVTTFKYQLANKIKGNWGTIHMRHNPFDSFSELPDLKGLLEELIDCPYDLTLPSGENILQILKQKLEMEKIDSGTGSISPANP